MWASIGIGGLVQLDFDVVRACRSAERFRHFLIAGSLDDQGDFVFVSNETNTEVSFARLMTEGGDTIVFLPTVLAVLDDRTEGWMLPEERFEATSTEVAQVFATACCELADFVRHRWGSCLCHVVGTWPRAIRTRGSGEKQYNCVIIL